MTEQTNPLKRYNGNKIILEDGTYLWKFHKISEVQKPKVDWSTKPPTKDENKTELKLVFTFTLKTDEGNAFCFVDTYPSAATERSRLRKIGRYLSKTLANFSDKPSKELDGKEWADVDLVWAELNNAIGTEIYIETKASEWGNNFISIVKPPSTGPTVKQATKKVEVKKEPEPEKQAILDDDENIPF